MTLSVKNLTNVPEKNSGGDGVQEDVTLNSFFEKDVRPYINLINDISDLGLGNELNLPSVVVIGDQSSGKSSILEAISGVQLPRGKEITTRCPIELHLKKAEGDCAALIEFTDRKKEKKSQKTNLESLDQDLRRVQDQIAEPGKVTNSKIVLKIQGPSCPDLCLTDLPGIVRTSLSGDKEIMPMIRTLIDDYITRDNVIILCVIPANLDVATNEALTIAGQHDPCRKRTIGVVTKADLVEPGCENSVMELLHNRQVRLDMGYCIVRCRNARELSISHAEAIAQEKRFFDQHPQFRQLRPASRGTESLSTKLTQLLVSHIKKQLPRMRAETRDKTAVLQKELDAFGSQVPASEEAKRHFMMDLLDNVRQDLNRYLMKGGRIPVDIIKSENVPVDEIDLKECDTSFLWRSLFQHFNEDISNITSGHLNLTKGELSVKEIQNRMVALRGNELPRFFNFELFQELVLTHLKLYEEPALECLEEITRGAEKITMHVCAEKLKQFPALLHEMEDECRRVLEECRQKAQEMVMRELKKEQLIYTQDSTYLSEIKKFVDSEHGPRSASSSLSGSETVKHLSVHLLHPEGEEGNEEQHNAQVMHHIVTVYLNVVNTRLSDSIPQTIRLDLYENFVDTISKSILRNFMNGDTTLVDEDEETASRRRELEEQIRRLREATKKLKNI